MTVGALGPHIDEPEKSGSMIEAADESAVVATICDIRIIGARLDEAGLAADIVPLAARNAARESAGAADAGIVLLRAADAIGKVIGGLDVIELRRREILIGPRLPARVRHACTAVAGLDHALSIVRRDPQIVIVSVRLVQYGEVLSTVRALHQRDVRCIHEIRIDRVCHDTRVVPGALANAVVAVDEAPRRAGVVRAIEAARIGLDERPDQRGLGARYLHADASEHSMREPGVMGELRPVLSAIGTLVDARAGTAG